MNSQMDKENGMEYCSTFKQKEILPCVTTWMDLNILLSEISQSLKDKYYDSTYNEVPKIASFIKSKRYDDCQEQRKGIMGSC